ncbi:MAG: cellobiose phosphorylase, partial [Candidatus Omnitrophica bacterium]|nr:cellobiose phosphorylase [Candidatus Omnitrophota bacterium]
LTNKDGSLLTSISPNLSGDIKSGNESFITPPASSIDLKSNLLCRRDFFIRLDKKIIRLSDNHSDLLEAGFLYHKIIKKFQGLQVEMINFIPYDLDIDIMWVRIINRSRKTKKLTPTSFMPLYGRSAENIRDHRHVSSLLNRIELHSYGLLLKPTMVFDENGHFLNDKTYFSFSFQDRFRPPLGQFPSLEYYIGKGDLLKPDALLKEVKPLTRAFDFLQGKETLASFRFKTEMLKPGEKKDYIIFTGMFSSSRNSQAKTLKFLKSLNSPEKVGLKLEKTKEYWQNYLKAIEFDFKDPDLNNWLLWVKFQPLLRKLFGCSFLPHFDYGKGGRGWRDLWQDALSLLITEPKKAKDLIIQSFKGVRIDGSNATIITSNGGFLSDRNKINRIWCDHGVWPYISLRLYLNRTGDTSLLLKEIHYFQDHLKSRAKVKDPGFLSQDFVMRTKNKSIYKGSILEHVLLELLTPFFNVGKHNIIKLENADWNDGLDMAAKNGESVAFSFLYADHLRDICFFLEQLKKKNKKIPLLQEIAILFDSLEKPIDYNNYKEKIKVLDRYYKATASLSGRKKYFYIDNLIYDLRKKSSHMFLWLRKKEWLNEGFFNGYYDNISRRVEGRNQQGMRMMLSSQVFSIMSAVATDKQVKKIWASITKYLQDKELGGFRLNTDFGSTYLNLGRAFGFSYGDKENGAFFNHMNVMLSFALLSQEFVAEGHKVFESIYNMSVSKKAKIYPLIPEYFNSQGQGLYLYLTGSASWYIYTLVEQILGLKFNLGNIVLAPKLQSENFRKNSIEFKFRFCQKNLHISYFKLGKNKGPLRVEKVFFNDKPLISFGKDFMIAGKDIKNYPGSKIHIKAYLR